MNAMLNRFLVLTAVAAATAAMQSCNSPNYPAGMIEQKYCAAGPWAVAVSLGGACCDSAGNKFDLYYPTPLGANGFQHPILTWANGTNTTSDH
jgi:hypothetical protein